MSLQFQLDLARELCEEARRFVRGRTGSKTIDNALECETRPFRRQARAFLTVPHYWAVYYHDGHGPIRPRKGKFLVYFKEADDDPRNAGGPPVRAREIKKLRLRPAEFRRLVKAGRLIVRKRTEPFEGRPFFEELTAFAPRAGVIARRRFSQFVRRELSRAGLLRTRVQSTILI